MRQCRTCGAELDAGANFCGHCGSAITLTAPAIPHNAKTQVVSSRKTSVAVAPPKRRLSPPPRASVSVRYGPIPRRAQLRPVERRPIYPKSRFLAAALEWIAPGFGVMYAGGFWKGALVFCGTFIATAVAVSVAMNNANGAQLEDVVDFFIWLFLAHLVWLLIRMIWAWRLASRATRLSRLYAAGA